MSNARQQCARSRLKDNSEMLQIVCALDFFWIFCYFTGLSNWMIDMLVICRVQSDWVSEYGLTSPSTHYRSFRRRVFPISHLHWYWIVRWIATTKVTAIEKPGGPRLAENCRPVSLLSTCYKLLERLVLHRWLPCSRLRHSYQCREWVSEWMSEWVSE